MRKETILYDDVEKKFIIDNFHKMSNETLSCQLSLIGYDRSAKSVQQFLTTRGFSRTKEEIYLFLREKYKDRYISDAESKFVKDNYHAMSNTELLEGLRQIGFERKSVKPIFIKLGIKRTREDLENIGATFISYTDEESSFITQNYKTMPFAYIADCLQSMGFNRTALSVKFFCRSNELIRTKEEAKFVRKKSYEIKKEKYAICTPATNIIFNIKTNKNGNF